MKKHQSLTIKDMLHRFMFENTPIRGNIVHLDDTLSAALQHQECPSFLRKILGELMAAAALLTATLKMEGALVLQIQGKGALKLLVVECAQAEHAHGLTMRATAKWTEDLVDSDLISMIGSGQFVITLDPKNGGEGYQGIVPLEGSSVAEILENYMLRSEQIETRIWLACDQQTASGMLIQKLPDAAPTQDQHDIEQDPDAWPRTCILAETVKEDELLTLSADKLIGRLFSQEDVRLFDAEMVRFKCSCSHQSVGTMLRLLGSDEVNSILNERDKIEVNCDFCHAEYVFDKVDIDHLFSADIMMPSSNARH